MDHGHGGHGDMDMGPQCTMNMLWNTQIVDTCIVFRQWHISSNFIFFLSCLTVIAISIGYEWLRAYQRNVDYSIALALCRSKSRPVSGRSSPLPDDYNAEEAGLLSNRVFKAKSLTPVPVVPRTLRATLYGASIFVSFFLMLVFMTYNAYLILAIVLGAAIGHYIFGGHMDIDGILSGRSESGKGMACH